MPRIFLYTLIKKYGYTKAVTKVTRLHAYVVTVMASLLTAASESGVLASAELNRDLLAESDGRLAIFVLSFPDQNKCRVFLPYQLASYFSSCKLVEVDVIA